MSQMGIAQPAQPWAMDASEPTQGSTRVYAIAFDMDTDMLQRTYHNPSWRNAYADIGHVLSGFGFSRQQGSVYFGNATVSPVTCVLAVQALTRAFSWFATSVRDIRMLRIEEMNDLMPAIRATLAAEQEAEDPGE